MQDGLQGIEISVLLQEPGWREAIPDIEPFAEAALRAALATRKEEARGEISALFTDDAAMRALNLRWRGKDKPTNVLSFPGGGEEFPGVPYAYGDIALGLETMRREAAEQGKTLRDHAAHLLVHGALHLLGHDHEAEEEAEAMERLETRILSALGVADPYAARGNAP